MGRKACHLSDDKSHAICKLHMSGNNMRTISKMLAIPRKITSNIIRTFKRTGNTEKPMSGGKEKLSIQYSGVVNRRMAFLEQKVTIREKNSTGLTTGILLKSPYTLPSIILKVYLLDMPSYKALNVNGISRSCRRRWCRKLSFSFPPDICFFLVFPVLLKVCMILEIVFLGIANICEILLKLLPDIYSLQIAWLLSSER